MISVHFFLGIPLRKLNGKKKMGRHPQFMLKLYNLINYCNEFHPHEFQWSHQGKTFMILDSKHLLDFETLEYFGFLDFKSFIQQLRIYGFVKINETENGEKYYCYYHPNFNSQMDERLLFRERKDWLNNTVTFNLEAIEKPHKSICQQPLVHNQQKIDNHFKFMVDKTDTFLSLDWNDHDSPCFDADIF